MAVALARVDVSLVQALPSQVAAMRDVLGEAVTRVWMAEVERAARGMPAVVRVVLHEVPEVLARVGEPLRPRVLRVVGEVLAARPAALADVLEVLPERVDQLDDGALSRFVAEALARHAREPHLGQAYLRGHTAEGRDALREAVRGVALSEVERTLSVYARAHCGAGVEIRAAPEGGGRPFTDGHHVYLPECIDVFGDDRDLTLYRVQTAVAVAYLEYGTFDLVLDDLAAPDGTWPEARDGENPVGRFTRGFHNVSLARDLFRRLEDARVRLRLREDYPGVARAMDTLGPQLWPQPSTPDAPVLRCLEAASRVAYGQPALELLPDEQSAVAPLLARLSTSERTNVQDSARAVLLIYPAIAALMARSSPGEPSAGQRSGPGRPKGRGDSPAEKPVTAPDAPGSVRAPELRTEVSGAEDRQAETLAERYRVERRVLGETATMTEARARARDVVRDAPEMVDVATMERMLERMRARGMRGATVDRRREDEAHAPDVGLARDKDATPSAGAVRYPEWDHTLGELRPDWTTVVPSRLLEGDRAWVDDVRAAEAASIRALRRRFEALRAQAPQRRRGEPDGDQLDLDRAIAETVEARVGHPRSGRVHARVVPGRREVAIAFLVDLSSSTNESADGSGRRILDVEKAALVVSGDALAALGDRFAIWGFSGYGRSHVSFLEAKSFEDPWDDRAARRLARMNFRMENRDGAAIRHATARLMKEPVQGRLLVLLSDGKPLDCGCDRYHGRYAQDDTQAALREARKRGIRVWCVTVDPTGANYLPRMYGDVAWTVIDHVDQLPQRLGRTIERLVR